jgi:hypothetical protein
MAFGAQQAQGVQRAGEGLFNLQSQNPVELAKTKLIGLDPTNPADQPQFIQLLNIIDPAKAAQFKQQLDAKKLSKDSSKERQGNFLKFLTKRHPDLLSLASGDNPVVTPENYKQYTKTDGLKLTDDQKEYAQAVSEGYKGTLVQYIDRNVKIGGDNLTNEQRHLAQINQENKAAGLPAMPLSTFLERKSAITGNLPDKVKIYNDAVRNGFEGDYLAFQQAEAKATRAPSKDDKRATQTDKSGFLRYVDDGKLVFPEVAAQLQKDADAEKQKEELKKTAALEHLTNAGMTVLADNLQNNVITPDKAMELANVDPRITTLANEHLQKSIDLGSQSSSALDQPAEAKRQIEAAFGVGDKNRLLTFAYAEGRIKESNILMPPGSVTEMEVKRSDATQPEITESPEVVKGYLYGKAKKNALGAAQENALQKWMINYQGNTSGFVDYWMSVINDPIQLQKIFDKAGIPPNENFKRRVISGAKI